ncbi:hypothetical protein L1049_025285 [Liquidambar formosana]|uniref:Uncharacterized protein n=1 Tax=Liquidambar formosana TaxID=63359 RepID=A0AAP0N8G1_LIQFO
MKAVHMKNSFSVALVAIILLLIQHCRANTSLMNYDTRQCNGPIHECDLDLELLFDADINARLLAAGKPSTVTGGTGKKGAAVADCHGKYANCLPMDNLHRHCGSAYRRDCS